MVDIPDISQGWLALLGAVLGGSGLKVIEAWLNRSKEKDDAASQLRNELRGEIRSLRDELKNVEDELDKWRGKYYELLDEFVRAKGDLAAAVRNLRNNTLDE
jgi:predicted  nucleic acid-binding Zn-ribbon protein